MKLVAILRIKNEILHIERCLSRLSELVDEIVILDNGSTDGTLEVYPRFKKVVQLLQTEGFDEGRDKIMLLDAARERKADWVLWLDGDELLEQAFTRNQINKYMTSGINKIAFRLVNFWLTDTKFRVDGRFFQYSLYPRVRMWRNVQGAHFRDRKIHNGEIEGVPGRVKVVPYRLLHYGYVDEDKIQKKVALYNKVDQSGSRSYDHIKPDSSAICIKYIEFRSRVLNWMLIHAYQFLTATLFLLFRSYKKLIK